MPKSGGVPEREGHDGGFVLPSTWRRHGADHVRLRYGPFRWVCLSGKSETYGKTDRAAMECIDPNGDFKTG